MNDISLGRIPVYIDEKMLLIEIFVEHYQVEEDNYEYINKKIYKNKYVLSKYVNINNKVKYNDLNIKFPINLINMVFTHSYSYFDIHDFKEKLEVIRNTIINKFNSDKIIGIYNNIINGTLELYNHEKEFDYDIVECYFMYIDNELNKLYINYQDNIDEIYIFLSFKNIDFINVYEDFYNTLR